MGHSIKVTDFGVTPGSRADATAAVAKALAAAKAGDTVEFAPGTYHFYRSGGFERELYLSNSDVVNPRRISILIEKRNGLQIKGNGARLIFHDRVMPIAILGSRKIDIEGLEIDWERPLMSQGTVLASDGTGFTLKIDRRKYPYVVEDGKIFFTDKDWKRAPWSMMEFDPKSKGVAYRTGDEGFTDGNWRGAKVSEPEPGIVRFDYSCRRWPKVGDAMAIRHGVRDHAGTFVLDSKDVSLRDVKYRHTSGLGVLCQYSENLTFHGVDVAPDPKGDRVFAGHDDGFHFSNCKGKILVDGSIFGGLMDDPINVHGTSVQVVAKVDEHRLRCRFMHGQSIGLRFGDPSDEVSFLDHETMLIRAKGRIAEMKRISPEEFEVVFREPIPETLQVGDALENLTWTPSFTVRNSFFGRVRARGLLVSTPRKVLVENNVFQSSGAAILIPGDANGWFESGAVTDVTIRHNVFENCNTSAYQFGDAVISIHPEIPKPGAGAFHRNIRIEDNVVKAFDAPILWALSTSGLTFARNVVSQSNDFADWRGSKDAITLLSCDHVRISDNKVDRAFAGFGVKKSGCDEKTLKILWP